MSPDAVSSIAVSDPRNSARAAVGGGAAADLVEFISFAVGEAQYGVDIMAVREIKEWSPVTHLPRQPDYVRGVLNLRGIMVPIIDLRCHFGEGLTEPTPTHIIVVVQIEGRQVGLLADRVLDIVSFARGKIQPVPRTAQGINTDFLAGLVTLDDTMIALIDLARLLSAQVIESTVAPNAAA